MHAGLDAFSAEKVGAAFLVWRCQLLAARCIGHAAALPSFLARSLALAACPHQSQVMGTLKELCSDGHTVLVSIHQPRSSVFAMFDDLILMAGGYALRRAAMVGCSTEAVGRVVWWGRERGHRAPVLGPSAD